MSGPVALLLLPTAGSRAAVPSSSPEANPSQIQHLPLLAASCSSWSPGPGLSQELAPSPLLPRAGTPSQPPLHSSWNAPSDFQTSSMHTGSCCCRSSPHSVRGLRPGERFCFQEEAAGLQAAHSLVAQLPAYGYSREKPKVWFGNRTESQSAELHPWQGEQLCPEAAAIP